MYHDNMAYHLLSVFIRYQNILKDKWEKSRLIYEKNVSISPNILSLSSSHIYKLTSGEMNTLATAYRACSGQGKNQSMLELFTIPG